MPRAWVGAATAAKGMAAVNAASGFGAAAESDMEVKEGEEEQQKAGRYQSSLFLVEEGDGRGRGLRSSSV